MHMHTLSGDVYEGDWEHGVKHGHGKETYANGASFGVSLESNTFIVECTRALCQAMSTKETMKMMSSMAKANIPVLTVRRMMFLP